MAEKKGMSSGAAGGAAKDGGGSLLERAVQATERTEPETTKQLLSVVIQEALNGVVTWDHNVTKTIETAIEKIDEAASKQLAAVMQQEKFQRLEGSWRGLQKLVRESDLGAGLKIKLNDFSQRELLEQFQDAPAIDRSPLFNLVYQEEYGTAGGSPFGALLGDYEFTPSTDDMTLLTNMAQVAAASHAPFFSAASPAMFDYTGFGQFGDNKPVAASFDLPTYAAWNGFRAMDESRYAVLTLPRTMARLPYGARGSYTDAFKYEELETDKAGNPNPSDESQLVWSNAAYELALKMTQAYTASGWCTATRGLENGGKVEGLPNLVCVTEDGDLKQVCPTGVNLTDEREKELSDLGFLPLVHFKDSNYAAFIGSQTCQKPKTYTDPDASSNAAISARLSYIMASSRIAHYLKVMGRNWLGSAYEAPDITRMYTDWINTFTNSGAIGNASRAKTPLAASAVEVEAVPGRPGSYRAIAYLRPWLQLEELTTSIRMVANIPGG